MPWNFVSSPHGPPWTSTWRFNAPFLPPSEAQRQTRRYERFCKPPPPFLLATGSSTPSDWLGFAGVGKPWKVERALVAAGCDLVDFIPLPDHAAYDEALLKQLAAQAEAAGAGLVTTEKDWARLPPAWRERVAAWPVRARFEDEAALDALLARAAG